MQLGTALVILGIIVLILSITKIGQWQAAIGCLLICGGVSVVFREIFPESADDFGKIALSICALFGISFSIARLAGKDGKNA